MAQADDHAGPVWRRIGSAVRLAAAARSGPLVAVAVATVVQGVMPVVSAWSMKALLDDIVRPGPGAGYWGLAGLVGSAMVITLLPQVQRHLFDEIRRGLEVLVQTRLAEALNNLPGIQRLEEPAFHDRVRLATQAAQSVPGQVIQTGFGLLEGLITLVGFLVTLVVLDPRLAVLALLGGVPALVLEVRLSRSRAGLMWMLSPARRRAAAYFAAPSDEQAAKEIRVFGLGTFFVERLRRLLTAANNEERDLGLRQLRVQAGLAATGVVMLGIGLALIARQALSGALAVGDVAVAVAAFGATQNGGGGLVRDISTVHHALLLFGHYEYVLAATRPTTVAARPVAALRSGIELRDVWFRYDDDAEWALRGVDLDLPAGATVALVGPNGAGKSTLIKLLCRLYEPSRGTIRWNGDDLGELDPAAVRERISAVFQDFVPWELTAAENIALGDLSALDDRPRIEAAARRSGVHGAVSRLSHGYDTLLSRVLSIDEPDGTAGGNTTLSGGQWQRLAIARALMADRCDLLILDEPTSGLDAEAEFRLHGELEKLRAGRTTLVVSHRLRTAREADIIVVLEEGSVLERGTHDDLMARDGRYAELFRMQATGYDITTPSTV
jgi:ATP-binding cassette, subfamily B, bacterial